MTRNERLRLLLLDAIAVAIGVFTFIQGGEPDILFHVMWVVLVFQAFLYGLSVSGKRIVLAAVAVVVYSIVEEPAGLEPIEVTDLLFTEWPLMLVIITVVAVMADRVTTSRRNIAALERRTHRQLLTAREDERRRLSADLHDGLGQTLTALVLTLDAAEAGLPSDQAASTSASRAAVARAQEIAATALEETHEVTRRLRPARMRELGLATAIRELAAHAGRPVEVEFDPRLAAPGILSVDEEMQAYRIVQEALANAVRHASASTITIAMRVVRGNRLEIDVADDGTGFAVHRDPGRGLGLAGMRERASTIGATFRLESAPGSGTKVRLQVPLRADAALA